jgi:hypothetical protein
MAELSQQFRKTVSALPFLFRRLFRLFRLMAKLRFMRPIGLNTAC